MKHLLLFFSLCIIVITAQSQVKFGIKAGGNFASVRYIQEDISKARLGIYGGVALEAAVANGLVIRPEVLYSSKGFGFKATAENMSGSQRLNYISVPVLLGLYPTKKLCLLAGPEFGFLSKAVTRSQGITEDNTAFYRHFDIGIDLGAAFNLTREFAIEGRFNYGFKDLANVVFTDSSGTVIAQGKSGASSVLQLGIVWWVE